MNVKQPTASEGYEEVAGYLLEQMGDVLGLGLERVEGKQKLVGKSGHTWTIDDKGIKADTGAVVCHRVSPVHQFQTQASGYGIAGVHDRRCWRSGHSGLAYSPLCRQPANARHVESTTGPSCRTMGTEYLKAHGL